MSNKPKWRKSSYMLEHPSIFEYFRNKVKISNCGQSAGKTRIRKVYITIQSRDFMENRTLERLVKFKNYLDSKLAKAKEEFRIEPNSHAELEISNYRSIKRALYREFPELRKK